MVVWVISYIDHFNLKFKIEKIVKIAFVLLLFHFKTKMTTKYLLPRLAHNYGKSEYDELQ